MRAALLLQKPEWPRSHSVADRSSLPVYQQVGRWGQLFLFSPYYSLSFILDRSTTVYSHSLFSFSRFCLWPVQSMENANSRT